MKYLKKTTAIMLGSTALLALSTANAMASCAFSDAAPADAIAPGHSSSKHELEVQKAKLQVGPSSDQCYNQNQTGGAGEANANWIGLSTSKNDHFYQEGTTSIYFHQSEKGHRTELRVEDQFRATESGDNYVHVKAKIIEKGDDVRSVILAQVHVDNTGQIGPLAALNWAAAGVNQTAWDASPAGMWVTLRRTMSCATDGNTDQVTGEEGNTRECFSHIYLGPLEGTLTDYKMGIFNGKFRIKVSNVNQKYKMRDIYNFDDDDTLDERTALIANIDISNNEDWNDKDLYLKAGVYITKVFDNSNNDGVTAQFKKLAFVGSEIDHD